MEKRIPNEFLSEESARTCIRQIVKIQHDRLTEFYNQVRLGLKEEITDEEFHSEHKIVDINTLYQFIDELSYTQLAYLNSLLELFMETSSIQYEGSMEERVQQEIKDTLSMIHLKEEI